MEQEKNIIVTMIDQNLKVNIKMEKEMGKEENIIMKDIYCLKVNIKMEKEMEKVQNIIIMMEN